MSTEATPGSPESNAATETPESQTHAADAAKKAEAVRVFAAAAAAARQAVNEEAAAEAEAAAGLPRHHDDQIAELRRDLSDLKDKNLRLLADMENLRRRTEEEKTSSAKYAIQRFATDIVSIGDNFQRAMSAVPAGAADTDPALKSLIEGVELTEREYLKVLEAHGVKRIVSKGALFSPHFHQPMMQVPNPDVPAGTILQVFQDGYTIGDRLLRAAVVAVAEGGPKPASKAVDETAPSSSAASNGPGSAEPLG